MSSEDKRVPVSTSFRRPVLMCTRPQGTQVVGDPNYTWIAEYMGQRKVSMEVAMEMLAMEYKKHIEAAKKGMERLLGSDEEMMKECRAFCDGYTYTEGFYSPIVDKEPE